jgi:hypothetical protein
VSAVEFKLAGVLKFLVEPEARSGARMTVRYGPFTLTAWGDQMAYTLPVDYAVEMQVSYVDSHGNPAAVDGEVAWSTSNPDTVTVKADANDSTKVLVQAMSHTGNAQVTATADADLGAGVTSLVTNMDITVVAGQAVAGTIAPVGEQMPPQATPAAKRR